MAYHIKTTCDLSAFGLGSIDMVLPSTQKIEKLVDEMIINLNLSADEINTHYILINRRTMNVITRTESLSDANVKDGDYLIFK